MRILFLTRLYWPHIGGVETHVENLSFSLRKKKHQVTILTEKFDRNLKETEVKKGLTIVRFSHPKIKYLGLIYIWLWLFKHIDIIRDSDIVHAHDVFIWYLPFRFLYPKKRVYTTFHGWEGVYPIPLKNILLKKIAVKLSQGNICVGKYIQKYYGIKADFVTYGAVDTTLLYSDVVKDKRLIVYVGRLEKDTGLPIFLKNLKGVRYKKVLFCGDGTMRQECEKYGRVLGFVDPKPYLAKASICFPSGYLSALEAMAYKCRLWVGCDNPLKKDYWKLSPFWGWIDTDKIEEAHKWAKKQTWEKLASQYIKLWD